MAIIARSSAQGLPPCRNSALISRRHSMPVFLITDGSREWQERTWEEPRAVESAVTYRRPEVGSGQPPEVGQAVVEETGVAEGDGESHWSARDQASGQREAWSAQQQVPHRWNSCRGATRSSRRLAPAPVQSEAAVPSPAGHQNSHHRTSAPALNVHHSRAPPDGHRVPPSHPQEPRLASHGVSTAQESRRPAPVCERQSWPSAAGPYHRICIQRRQKGFGLSLAWTCPPR